MRHDIDYSIEKSLKLARIEAEEGISSTYFVLLTSEFYNVMAKENIDKLCEIQSLGHDIGLHFDEMNYTYDVGMDMIKEHIMKEADILGTILNLKIDTVSMHRPSKMTLDADYQLGNIVNSYGQKFFKDFKYISDSRCRWRENVEEIISSMKFKHLHILTHAFWYNEDDKNIENSVMSFINGGNVERYRIMEQNITDLSSIIKREDII